MLNLDFSSEQEMLGEMVRNLCTEYSSPELVRELEDDPKGYNEDLWKQLGQLDLLGLMMDPDHGGSGQSMLEGVVVYQEFGRALAATPHFESCVMGAGVLTAAGSDSQKTAWLPKIASGETIVTPAWMELSGGYKPAGIETTAKAEGDDFVINGTKHYVTYASAADAFVVVAQTGDAGSAEGIALFMVDASADGISLEQRKSISSDTQFKVDFDGVKVPASAMIGAPGTGWATWNDTLTDGIILLAATAIGGNEYALEITVQYSKDRHQFDKPLAAFQALAHDMANARTSLDGARILVHEAAWAHGRKPEDVARLAPMAKMFACNAYRDTTAMAQQIWGGVGFTLEYDIQLYFRRAKQLQITWWDTRHLEGLIADQVMAA